MGEPVMGIKELAIAVISINIHLQFDASFLLLISFTNQSPQRRGNDISNSHQVGNQL
ncbi:hypothetical protein [Microbulbifer sp. GL-2]|uniref:hypothetical protein n=1 Tax=Microbulbifer sp. GL-2 TaxID=2591606 RepID=UPI00155A5770|nr:hypothetical protein [Microbulbifer sp. GL-2]